MMAIDDFTIEEIDRLYGTCFGGHSKEIKLWKRAFDFYNDKKEHKLSMGCMPCFQKVLLFICINRIKNFNAEP